ncbi:hypothetical protein [Nonomuraea sp. NPDC049309]|uniref:hypothetical protein n=1 Tax=Nonomuraea sp. NPDC049309 TaxID=3364350 RepID=UPI00371D1FF4
MLEKSFRGMPRTLATSSASVVENGLTSTIADDTTDSVASDRAERALPTAAVRPAEREHDGHGDGGQPGVRRERRHGHAQRDDAGERERLVRRQPQPTAADGCGPSGGGAAGGWGLFGGGVGGGWGLFGGGVGGGRGPFGGGARRRSPVVLRPSGSVAGLGVSTPDGRTTEERRAEFGVLVTEAAAAPSRH